MGRLAQEQLKNILDAYAQADAGKAMIVWRSDEELDALYNSIFRADDQMLVNTHVLGSAAFLAPVLHLQRVSGGELFTTYAELTAGLDDASRDKVFADNAERVYRC